MASTATTPPPSLVVKDAREKLSLFERLKKGDEATFLVTFASALSIIVVTCLLVQHLWIDSVLSRHAFGWKFLHTSTWDPVADQYGALPFIYGTVVTSFLALLLAVPVGIGAAIFLAELAPRRLSNVLTFMIELLAAVPSVIYGLLGIFVLLPILRDYVVPPLQKTLGFLPIFKGAFYGVSYFSAACVLAIMIVPFIVSISREVLLAVPQAQREAMMALGATKWDVTWKSVVPYAQRGMIGSVFLALARALGETMAVTMVIGNVPAIHASLLSPGYTIAAVIANEFTEATGDLYISALIELALVLFAVTMIINAIARLLLLGMKSQETTH
ncbi:MAG: phosphate ABC transporter permease subunit PstC [Acidobacteriaceae bacterium]